MTRLWLLLELILFVQCQLNCFDQNIRYNGDTLTVTNAKTSDECFSQCQRRSKECGGWTWSKGKCEMKKLSRPGDKVAGAGMVSGTSKQCSINNNVTSVSCKYADDNKDVFCIFPFIGDNPGQKSGGGTHDTCLKTKKGRSWCATKLSSGNRVIGTSVQNRDVSCSNENYKCASGSSLSFSSSRTTTKRSSTTTRRSTTRKTTKRTNTPNSDDGVTDAELREFTEDLLKIDDDDVANLVTIDPGCSTRVGRPNDCSPNKLIKNVDNSILRRPVYRKLSALYENYDSNVRIKEDRTSAERKEEEAFLDEVMKSKVMIKTLQFLKDQKIYTKSASDFRKLLKELWFEVYSRGDRILGSSGFEHVFLGEKKNDTVQGFHNWVYFHHLEQKNQINYLGHWEEKELNGKGTGLAFTFKWGKEQKPYASMIIGTSPQFELALYTTCLLVRGDKKCDVSLGGQQGTVNTHVFNRPRGVRYIASAFIDWK